MPDFNEAAEGETNAYLGVLSLTWQRSQCVLAHSFKNVEQAIEVKNRLFSFAYLLTALYAGWHVGHQQRISTPVC